MDGTLAISWRIATEPRLYWQLAPNPYSPLAVQIIAERFPNSPAADIIRAVILAEPEREYDRNFKKLPPEVQGAEVYLQTLKTTAIAKHLNEYYRQYALKLAQLSEDLLYDILCKTAFETNNLQEIELKYSQNQRKQIKLLILNLMGEVQSSRLIETQLVISKPKGSFPKVTLAVFFFISLFFLTFIFLGKQGVVASATNQIVNRKVQNIVPPIKEQEQHETQAFPVRLKIPGINVDAAIEYVGLTPQGAMDVPGHNGTVGWYKFGPSPGATGSAVISGHFDGKKGESGVFNNLNKLKPGDKIYVINDQGATVAFSVREGKTYNPGYADEVFSPNDSGTHLNLITCDGIWDKNNKSYSKRLVVFADITR